MRDAQIDNERMLDSRECTSLRVEMLHLTQSNDRDLLQHLEREEVRLSLSRSRGVNSQFRQ